MAESTEHREGGCLCGSVRYRVDGAPKWAAHCHCTSCRRATGAPFVTYAGFATAAFAFTAGQPAAHASSPGVARRFCPHCGTPLTYESARWPDEVHILVGTLDDPESVTPQGHVYTSEQLAWVHLDDGLPTFGTTAGGA